MKLKKASRSAAYLKIGLTGPSGSGKTYSALLLALGLCNDWERIAVIDTEHGAADLYSELGPYSTLTLEPPYSPERYIEALQMCLKAQMSVIIIDSASMEWDGAGGCLEIQTDLGGRYQDWARVTPRHRRFVEEILQAPAHIIATTRTKTDHSIDKDNRGRVVVRKLGTKDVQRDGWEFELTTVFALSHPAHLALCSKDRTSLFMDRPDFLISEETGREFAAWSNGSTVELEPESKPVGKPTKPKKPRKAKKSAKKGTSKKAKPGPAKAPEDSTPPEPAPETNGLDENERRKLAIPAFESLFERERIPKDHRDNALRYVCDLLGWVTEDGDHYTWTDVFNCSLEINTLGRLYQTLDDPPVIDQIRSLVDEAALQTI